MSKSLDDTDDRSRTGRGELSDPERESDLDSDLAKLLASKSIQGRLMLADERMLLIRQEAFGFLRTLLFKSLGTARAETVLTQFGYLCGLGDYQNTDIRAHAGSERADRGDAAGDEALDHESHWLSWTGLAHLEPLHMEIDRAREHFLFRGRWHNSYEAELHLDQFGASERPVCRSLTGYASGWCTAFFGQPVTAVEERCAGQGDEYCQWQVKPIDEWGKEVGRWRDALVGTDRGDETQPTGLFELEALVESLRRENAALIERARAKSEFLADVNHEFRTPLTLMLGPLATILDVQGEQLSPQLAFELRRIRRNGERLYRLVNEMLDFTKLEAGAMRPSLGEVDITQLVQTVMEDARWQAEQKQIVLTTDFDPRLSPQRVDEHMVEKCLINLLGNALHFTPEQGQIAVSTVVRATEFLVIVEDTGPGIPKEQHEHVFQRFQQVARAGARGRGQHGAGLGLALVRQFAELHQGRVELDSQPGRGARFTIHLPRRDASAERTDEWRPVKVGDATATGARAITDPDARALSSSLAGDVAGGLTGDVAATSKTSLVPRFERQPAPWPELVVRPVERGPDPDGERARPGEFDAAERPLILVADDDPDIRALIREILRPRFEVVEAEDGVHAWQSICARQPDVAVLDVMMPRLDGQELVQRIKSEPLLRMIPCILITANAGRNASVSALDSGADDFLAKPFFADELSARVRAAARMRRMYRELHQSRTRLSALETQHSAVIDNASDGIVVFERGGGIRTWNRSMRQIFGYTEAEVQGATIDILAARGPQLEYSDDENQRVLGASSYRWLHLAEFHSCEWRLRHKDGHYIDIESSRSEITINQEPLFVEVIRDIRERKRAEKRLAEANRQLLSLSRVAGKAELATGVLHNVGNVLQSVKVNVAKLDELVMRARVDRLNQVVDMLALPPDELVKFLTEDSRGQLLPRYLDKLVSMLGRNLESGRRAVDDASLGIEQIENIVRAQQENARTVLVKTPVVLNALIGDVLRLLDLRGPAPRVVHDSGGDIAITLDRHRIVDIVINLLENAFDATGHLPVDERSVTLRTEMDGERLRIAVIDNGIGIDADGLTQIFIHGYTSKPGGRGFGLHVSALSAKEMNGSLRAESAGLGQGARFILELPVDVE